MDLTHEISNRLNTRLTRSKSPYIRIFSPDGGTFEQPYTIIILWNSGYFNNFYFPNVKLELYKNGLFNKTIITSTPNNGVYQYLLEDNSNSDYQIKISVVNLEYVYGFSSEFSLTGGEIIINPWMLTNYYYGENIPYDNKGWLITNYSYEVNTSIDTFPVGWMILTNGTDDPGIPE